MCSDVTRDRYNGLAMSIPSQFPALVRTPAEIAAASSAAAIYLDGRAATAGTKRKADDNPVVVTRAPKAVAVRAEPMPATAATASRGTKRRVTFGNNSTVTFAADDIVGGGSGRHKKRRRGGSRTTRRRPRRIYL